MSSAVVSTSAALGRPFVFDNKVGSPAHTSRVSLDQTAEGRRLHMYQPKILPSSVTPASHLEIRPAPERVCSGVPAIDALTGGLPRGCLTEICGPASSGRTTLLLGALTSATSREEFCAVVDASDALDPLSVAAAGVDLDRLLWVRCGESSSRKELSPQRQRGTEISDFEIDSEDKIKSRREQHQTEHRIEQALRATDLLLESGGFGLIVLDLVDLPPQTTRRIPLTTWFRFRRAIENTPTILLAIEQHPIAGSCSSLLLQLSQPGNSISADARATKQNTAHGESRGLKAGDVKAPEGRKQIGSQVAEPTNAQILTGLDITAELIRSRMGRKPACSTAAFTSKTAWAG